MNTMMASDYLIRNGIVAERARRAGRSLDAVERNIILAGRKMAMVKGMDRNQMNYYEMTGERSRDQVLSPIKVSVVFQHYTEPYEDLPAEASYFILESNHPSLPKHGNVGRDQLIAANVKIPKTPDYESWKRKRGVRS